jgi:hypothetical protein
MPAQLSEILAAKIRGAENSYYRLVLLVGGPRSGKTSVLNELAKERSWPAVNVNLALCERLLELTIKQRALGVQSLLAQIINERGGDVMLLDNIEILFSKELQQDPLRLLQGLSRNRTIVSAWAGEYDGANLIYADSAHPEFRRYHKPDAIIVSTLATQHELE